jgi:lycopene cyclase domain-containing protein
MSTYLLINILAISIPLLVTFHSRFKFYKRWNALWPALILPAIFFIIWDIYFTDLGVWGFNPAHLIGIKIFNLPLEEVLFFIAIPYACMFTYDVLRQNITLRIKRNHLNIFVFALALILLITGLFNIDKWYTGTTFILTAFFLFIHIYLFKSNYLGHFFIAYAIIYLFPFLIVNGLLTGSMLNEPVVWYNNEENLGLRIFTIPVEDFIYGMLLYLMNTSLYEALQTSKVRIYLKKIAWSN